MINSNLPVLRREKIISKLLPVPFLCENIKIPEMCHKSKAPHLAFPKIQNLLCQVLTGGTYIRNTNWSKLLRPILTLELSMLATYWCAHLFYSAPFQSLPPCFNSVLPTPTCTHCTVVCTHQHWNPLEVKS